MLVARAQDAGVLRADVASPEVYGLMIGVSRATPTALRDDTLRDKAVAIVFDGLAPVNDRV